MGTRSEDIETGRITVLRKGTVRGKGDSQEQAPLTLAFGYNLNAGLLMKVIDSSGKTSATAAFSVSQASKIAELVLEAAEKMRSESRPGR